jgi:V-type H+-transporting ATPase subunit A
MYGNVVELSLTFDFKSPSQGQEPIMQKLDALHTEIQDRFRQMVE